MIEAVSCGGIVIYRGKILTLYKSYRNKYEGWVLPKGTVEPGETHEQTAVREVYEESGVHGTIIKYVGKSQYSFSIPEDTVEKEVHWYLMASSGYYSRPQREEYFVDSGYYKYHEAYHLLKFSNERQILEKAYQEYLEHIDQTEQFAAVHPRCRLELTADSTFRNLEIVMHEGRWAMVSKEKSPAIHFVIRHAKLRSAIESFEPPLVEE